MSVKEEIIDYFNNESLIEFFGRYNLKMTDAMKSGKVRKYCSINEATYLKRAFKEHPLRKDEWLAPLEKASITDTANWIWKCVGQKQASLINSEQCCRLAYSQGPEYYNWIVKTITERWAEEGVFFEAPDWMTLDRAVWDDIKAVPFKFSEVEGQMDVEHSTEPSTVVQDHSGNVVIDHTQVIEKGATHSVIRGFEDYSISSEKQIYQTMTDRWLYVNSYTWNIAHQVNFNILGELAMPITVLRNNINSQNLQLFLTHRWFRFDSMIIKVVLNSNAFQVGQLVLYWTYGNTYINKEGYDNVWSGMQRNCAYINAGSSNDVELEIPYHYFNSMMQVNMNAVMGWLSCRVLNPLVVTGSVAPSCHLSMYVTFKQARFYGMVSRELGVAALSDYDDPIEPQMDPVTALIGVQTLKSIIEPNRDNPPVPLQPPSWIPQASASFCYTDQVVEPINVLRADPRGQVPTLQDRNEMNPLQIARGWGFVKTVTWETQRNTGDTLESFKNIPFLERSEYPEIPTKDGEKALYHFIPTPLAMISSFYGFWRGDIEWKIRVVASKFHTGRIMIGCIPMYDKDTCDINVLKLSPHQSIDILSSTEVVFRAPWYWKNSFARVRDSSVPDEVPSKIYLIVQNPLICIDSVPAKVYLNVYVRAADNFEVSILKHPLLCASNSEHLPPPSGQFLDLYNKENRLYITYSTRVPMEGDKLYSITLYVQNVTDGFEGFIPTSVKAGIVYRLHERCKNGYQFRIMGKMTYVTNKQISNIQKIRYGVWDPRLTTSNAKGLVVFGDNVYHLQGAIKFARDVSIAIEKPEREQEAILKKSALHNCPAWVEDSSWSQINDGSGWVDANNYTEPVWEKHWAPAVNIDECESLSSFSDLDIEAQMDTRIRTVVTALDEPTPSTNNGEQIFGEKTPDLKSLCRRWTSLGTAHVAGAKDTIYGSRLAFRIKISPKLLVLADQAHSYEAYVKDGPISLAASMFTYWRGSLRYRFISSVNVGTLYVQHRFDIPSDNDAPFIEKIDTIKEEINNYMMPQYATFAHCFSVNPIFSIEVPYYQQQECLNLMPSTFDCCNGMLYCWYVSPYPKAVNSFDILYSLGDDTRFSVFQGCPTVVDLSEMGNISLNIHP